MNTTMNATLRRSAAISQAQRMGLAIPRKPNYPAYVLVALCGPAFFGIPTLLICIYAAIRQNGYSAQMNSLMLSLPRR